MRIALVTDTWYPQINGVVTTLATVARKANERGHELDVIHPGEFKNIPCPTYPEIRLALFQGKKIQERLSDVDAVHIANEGPLGIAARSICAKNKWPYTTAFHTRLSEYANERFPVFPVWLGYQFLRWFHKHSSGVLVPSKDMIKLLERHKFNNLVRWTRGVDSELFKPREVEHNFKSPVYLSVGRVSVEKNLDAFLSLNLPGTKIVVGDGPHLPKLKAKYKDVVFTGYKQGEELAEYFSLADVFVFPSKSDTYGLVQLEALASGTPIAAYPVTGPIDIVTDEVGCLSNNLKEAIFEALNKDRYKCREYALRQSWDDCIDIFLNNLKPIKNAKT